ncbi:MAG: 3-dehydroquinate synthase [Polyangiales bacterium]
MNGPPGAGKSTLAPALAARLGVTSVDLDALVAARAGMSAGALIAARGEPALRALEAELLDGLLRTDAACVVALGGGALTSSSLRRRALREARVLALHASPETLLARIAAGAPRPLVTASRDPARALRELLEARAEGYAEAHRTLSSEAHDVAALAAEAAAWASAPAPMVVPLGARSYRVYTGPVAGLGAVFGQELSPHTSCHGVTESTVARCCAWMRPALPEVRGAWLTLRAGEASKTLRGAERVWAHVLAQGIDRRGVLLCHGGGVISDLGGFAASALLRGVRYATVPTTLLAMLDASVGGKTAVDHRLGKNLIGAFHHPSLVWMDVEALRTLPRREIRAGLAEAVKIAVVRDGELLQILERDAARLARGDDLDALRAVLVRAVRAKIDVVAEDEREGGVRALLNFGHTVGHAVEAASGYRLRHGECVAIGMRAALALGADLGVTPPALRTRVGDLLDRLGLPARAAVDETRAAEALGRDKKRVGETLRFVLATAAGEASLRDVPWARAHDVLRAVIETRSTGRSRL